MKLIPEGKYKAKVYNYGIKAIQNGENKGQPSPTIIFEVEGVGHVFWQGNFGVKARKIALKALIHCGLSSPHLIPKLAAGPKGGALDMEQEVEIDVIHETVKDYNGEMKTYAKVAWVNPLGGSIKDAMTQEEFTPFVADMGLQGDFVTLFKEVGYKPTTVPGTTLPYNNTVAAAPQPAAFGEDIPF